MDVLADLRARGLIQDSTDPDALARRLAEGPVTAYCGFDPTADSLHHGHLLGLLTLRRLQLAGHRPISLAGGATGMIGDPSGRSEERALLDDETLSRNLEGIRPQLARLLDFEPGPQQAVLVDNRDWTGELRLLEFLRDVGKHVTVNAMLAKESVRARMAAEHGISYTEFTYMLLQANDYLWLHEHHGCELQIGGSDQWGNITAGIDLIRRRTGATVHGLTWPLIMSAEGTKVGKTTGGQVWLAPERTSPYRFHQHWVQTADDAVERFLLQFTFLPVADIASLVEAHREAPERREAQRVLAREVTALVHGEAEARAAEAAAAVLFGGDAADLAPEALAAIAGEVPTTRRSRRALMGAALVELLAATGLASSRGDARRTVEQGGAYVNGRRVGDPEAVIGEPDLLHGRWVLLRKGKRQHHLIEAADGA